MATDRYKRLIMKILQAKLLTQTFFPFAVNQFNTLAYRNLSNATKRIFTLPEGRI